MRLLKYAILGLVNRNPMTGYDLSKEFDRGLVNFWYATHSQIYPELQRLTDEGLLTYEVDTRGDKLERKNYRITEKGRQDLAEWLAGRDALEPTPKDVFRLRLYYLPEDRPEELRGAILDQMEKRRAKLQRLERSMEQHRRRSPGYGEAMDAELGDYLVLCGAIRREKDYLGWLQDCLDTVDRLQQKTAGPKAGGET